ncbi:MAG: hypothetical protein AAF311_14865 [Pseudomonadota bacterium]
MAVSTLLAEVLSAVDMSSSSFWGGFCELEGRSGDQLDGGQDHDDYTDDVKNAVHELSPDLGPRLGI